MATSPAPIRGDRIIYEAPDICQRQSLEASLAARPLDVRVPKGMIYMVTGSSSPGVYSTFECGGETLGGGTAPTATYIRRSSHTGPTMPLVDIIHKSPVSTTQQI
jgi:hypothetical protein